jgi:hypothetical protein
MIRVRWFDNAQIDRKGWPPYTPIKLFVFACIVGFLIGFACQLVSLTVVDDEAGLVLAVDLILLPLSFPFTALIFLLLANVLVDIRRFGLATSLLLGACSVFGSPWQHCTASCPDPTPSRTRLSPRQ